MKQCRPWSNTTSRLPLLMLSIIATGAIALGACSAPLSSPGGNAKISVRVGGVVPPAPARAKSGGRTIFPNTATISISVDDGDDFSKTVDFTYASGATLSMTGLPDGEPLTVAVSALSPAKDVLTSWSGTVTLQAGENALTAVLKPELAPTTITSVTTNASPVDLLAGVSIPYGEARAFDIPVTVTDSYTQLLFDSGKASWVWMGVYDSSWAALAPTASDPNQGWAVLKPPADGVVRVVLANCVESPGYPAAAISGKIQARRAYFLTPTGSGSGWAPDDPYKLQTYVTGNSTWLLSEGTHSKNGTVSPMANSDNRFYGGFKSGDWSVRDPELYPSVVTNSASTPASTISITDATTGVIDGLTLIAGVPSTSAAASGLSVSTGATFVVSNCTINGNQSVATITASGSVVTYGAIISGSAAPEFSSCSISGGTVNAGASNSATTGALYISSTGGPYIHDCDIDGGKAGTNTAGYNANTNGAMIWNAGAFAVLARNRIWGGVASTSAVSSATSRGIILTTSAEGSAIVNCVVSGGYADGAGSSISTGISLNEYDAVVAGCTIDSGQAISGIANAQSVSVQNSVNTAGTLAASVMVSSASPAISIRVGLLEQPGPYGLSQLFGVGVAGCSPYYKNATLADFSSSAASKSNNLINTGRSPGSEFVSYAAPTSLTQFLELNWKPASAAVVAGTSSGTSPAACGIASATFSSYPALALDLAGAARSYTATWSRGAYE